MRFSTSDLFSWISFPQPQSIPLGPFNIFNNLQFKVHQWCQWHRWQIKNPQLENCYIFFGQPLSRRDNIKIIFFSSSSLQSLSSLILFPVFPTGMVDTSGKFATSSNETNDIGQWISKIFEMTLMQLSEAWGKMIHKRNKKQKSRDAVPLNFK
jgi:hypothetical protein